MKKALFLFVPALFVLMVSCENRQNTVKEESQAAATETASQPASTASSSSDVALASFDFKETTFDFGEIKQGDVVTHVFPFTNNGEAPLVISNIQTTCGCTTPQYTKDPIAPGESGEITVQFNSTGKSGVINKQVTIYANVPGGTSGLSIKTVVNTEAEIAGPFKKQPTQ